MPTHQGSSKPLVNTMLLAVSMRLPPHAIVAHIGRGVTPHCCWQPSMEPLRSKGCARRERAQFYSAALRKVNCTAENVILGTFRPSLAGFMAVT